jgi:hypothetical protein
MIDMVNKEKPRNIVQHDKDYAKNFYSEEIATNFLNELDIRLEENKETTEFALKTLSSNLLKEGLVTISILAKESRDKADLSLFNSMVIDHLSSSLLSISNFSFDNINEVSDAFVNNLKKVLAENVGYQLSIYNNLIDIPGFDRTETDYLRFFR